MRGSVGEGLMSDDALFEGELLRSRRELVRALYRSNNKVEDSTGRVTARLANSAGLDISLTAVTGLLKAMESDGWVERVVRGKRTFSIALNPNNHVVKRLIAYFDKANEPEEVPIPTSVIPVGPPDWSKEDDTSIVDAAKVADELLHRVVEILNGPALNEDAQRRLGEQMEYTQTLRSKCDKQEKEIRELKTTLAARDARIAALNRDNNRLESNLRAALKQERMHHGKGFHALEKFMQERPRNNC